MSRPGIPALLIDQFGDASANKAVNKTVNDDLAKAGELSIPITLIILLFAFGSFVAAGIPLLIGITSVIAALRWSGFRARSSRSTTTSPR